MPECETCGDEVPRLFSHRTRTETMTHKRTRRVCSDCHPALPSTSGQLVTDGGTRTRCPTCSGTTVADETGSSTCLECGWTQPR